MTSATSAAPLVDGAARERARRHLDRSMTVSAGAGTGKTTVLVDRLLALLESGADPGRVAVITFTEKAAAELFSRCRDRLEEALAEPSGGVAGAQPGRESRLEGILARLHDLTISTIHAFCQQLLNAESLRAGWAPGTEIAGESVAVPAVERAYTEWRRGFDERHPELAADLRRLVTRRTLRYGADALLERRDLTPVLGREEPPWAEAAEALEPISERILEAADQCLAPASCKLVANNAALLELLRHSRQGVDARAQVEPVLLSDEKGNLSGGRRDDWPGTSKQDFKDGVNDLRAWRGSWRPAVNEPLHRAVLTDLTEHFLPRVEAEKRAAGQADYQDLLLRAAALLKESPESRARLAGAYDAILVDEVQDTDPIQSEVVAILARHPDLVGDWQAHPPRPGHLFAVGDQKQSIYRFRRADPAQWAALERLVGRDGERETLIQNFRSVPGIIHFVNAAFSGVLPGYEPLRPWREPAMLEPVVLVEAGVGLEGLDPAGEPVVVDDTEAVARYLTELKAGGAQVWDRETGALRPLRWGDVMVVLPSWSNAEDIQDRLLRADIPARVEGGTAFFDRDEIRLLVAAMRAIEEPLDGEAIVFALRGLFGCSLDELTAHKGRGGSWYYLMPEQPPGPVTEALGVLRRLHRRRDRQSWVSTLDQLLEATRATAVWSAQARGPAALANLDKLGSLIRQIEAVATSSGAVISQLQRLSESQDAELPFFEEASESVFITTYFSAKGREAPVVVMAHAKRQRQTPVAIVDRAQGEVAIRLGTKLLPPGWAARLEREQQEDAEDRCRWMYVAATRARDQLVIVRNEASPLVELALSAALPMRGAVPDGGRHPIGPGAAIRVRHAARLAAAPDEQSTFPGLDRVVDDLLADPPAAGGGASSAWRAARVAEVRRAKRRATRRVSVTELARRGARRHRVTRAQTEAGRVVHQVMEHLDLTRPRAELMEAVPALVQAFADLEGLSQEVRASCEDIVERLLGDEVIDRLRAAPEHWKEVPFSFPEQGRVVSGTIDLMFPTSSTDGSSRRRWVVVDWKSDLPEPGDPRAEVYRRQLELYARAVVQTLAGVRPDDVETKLVGPHPELADEEEPLDEALSLVAEWMRDGLDALIEAGAPVPEVGVDIGEPVVASDVELVWDTERVAVAIGAIGASGVGEADDAELVALRELGWRVVSAAEGDDSWVEAVREALGLS